MARDPGYEARIADVVVRVRPQYLPEQSEPEERRWVWAYHIEVENRGQATVQLLARHWRITDATGHVEQVKGLGVVGEQPVLNPGESFRYTSGCPLTTPSGVMVGTYRMVGEGGQFDVHIPAFSLDLPDTLRVVN
ncbi:Co2+/Mg2+ efflux protein ApaG [Caulobacter sp. S45]|uniref:Co2+/Mg2+ efflux protein ApaG n=1 Tax=Caulobacter sp. S45 TaxID=1641861 RepID=UPI0015761CEC|nr:Co2+/Mg2+ efflux protein ApaG [Caulobacter sp. S45]